MPKPDTTHECPVCGEPGKRGKYGFWAECENCKMPEKTFPIFPSPTQMTGRERDFKQGLPGGQP